ncbi:MAG: type VI secretion protein [Legionellaceae bacterium]|nr:type VI secretion protein [Legionellaceae bacterium]|tara:strand:+ start:246 stop:542 length:297 start_codon:yes stop_codon:yes gene_type:complete
MDNQDEAVAVDPLFLGMTRPPMVAGVTYTFFVINGMATTIIFLGSGSLWAWLLGIPMHVAGYLLCLKDPRIFDLWRVKLLKTSTCRNRSFWHCNSYRP